MTDYKYPLHPFTKITDLKDMTEQAFQKFPDNTAFLTKPVKGKPYHPVSYTKYYHDIDAFGTQLLELGLGPDSRVAIVAETRYEWYVSYLAVTNGEAIVVPIDKELPEEGLLSLFNRSRCDAVIYSQALAQKVEAVAPQVPTLKHLIRMNDLGWAVEYREEEDPSEAYDGPDNTTLEDGTEVPVRSWNDMLRAGRALTENGDTRFKDVIIDPEAVRILLFTSGTTSRSKCVMHSHATICANLQEMGQLLFIAINNDDVVLSVLPLHHTYECTCGFLFQIYKGNTIAQVEGLRHITNNMKEAKVTTILYVPLLLEAVHKNVWKNIQKQDKEKLVRRMMGITKGLRKVGIDLRRKIFGNIHDAFGGSMKTFIAGGAAIDPQILQDFEQWGFVAVQGYGLTEFAPIMALNRERYFRHDSAGLPLPSVEVKVLNADEEGVGEFAGRGPNRMIGYYEDPELTAEAIVDGWYHTGDMGYITQEGFLIITGRKKNLIVTKSGKNVYPEELEALLNRNDEVTESVVSAEKDANGEQRIGVEIFPDMEGVTKRLGKENPSQQEIQALMEQLVKELNTKLQPYQYVRNVTLRGTEFEKNTSRKIMRDYSNTPQG